MNLPSIKERLYNKNISQLEIAQREAHIEIISSIHLSDDMHILSYSCGNGIWDYLSALYNPFIKKITATDIVPNPVRSDDQNLLNTLVKWEFIQVKPEDFLPFSDKNFDIVIHHDVIEHSKKPYLMIKEQYRVLKEGGILIVGTPNIFRPANVIKLITGRLSFPEKIGYYKEIGDYIHIQEFHEQQLKILLEEVGFKILIIKYCYFGIHPLRINISKFPKSDIGKRFCHYLLFVAQK